MAITMTPKQIRVLIDSLNTNYARQKREKSKVRKEDLPKEQQTAPLEKLIEKESSNPEFTKRLNFLNETYDPDGVTPVLRHFVKFGDTGYNEPNETEPSEDAFYSVEAPKSIWVPVTAYDWNMKEKGGPDEDSEKLLKKMNATERDWLFKKLNFKAEYKNHGDRSIGLYGELPIKKAVFNARFDMNGFINQVDKIQQRSEKEGLFDKEALIENIANVLDEKCQQEEDYRNDPDNIDDEYSYAREDAKHKPWKDLLGNIEDDGVLKYIEKLQAKDVDEDEIKKLLIETSDDEYSDSHYSVDNSIGSSHLSSEEELYMDNRDDWVEDAQKFPYPGDFDQNLALLDKEDMEKIKKEMNNGTMRFSYDDVADQFTIDSVTIYLGDNRSAHIVVNDKKFIMAASRLLKDLMLKRPRKKKELGASVADAERFPTLARILR